MDEAQRDDISIEDDKIVDPDAAIEAEILADDPIAKKTDVVTSNLMDEADVDNAEISELPGAVIEDDKVVSEVIPELDDEFTCVECFLVKHRSALSPKSKKGAPICVECA